MKLHEYTPAEWSACWYHQEEYDAITKECFRIVRKIEKGEPINSRKYCVLGLEKMTSVASDQRQLDRLNMYLAVLEEQHRQLEQGVYNAKRIAKAYKQAIRENQQGNRK